MCIQTYVSQASNWNVALLMALFFTTQINSPVSTYATVPFEIIARKEEAP